MAWDQFFDDGEFWNHFRVAYIADVSSIVDIIVFVAALSSFDEYVSPEKKVNKLVQRLFISLCIVLLINCWFLGGYIRCVATSVPEQAPKGYSHCFDAKQNRCPRIQIESWRRFLPLRAVVQERQ